MFCMARIALAGILALTVAALPLMLDRCAESCEGHQAVNPGCHHRDWRADVAGSLVLWT
jgi:hypothetical protein